MDAIIFKEKSNYSFSASQISMAKILTSPDSKTDPVILFFQLFFLTKKPH